VPLLEVLAPPGDDDVAGTCARIAREVAEVLGARPDAVWVTWSTFAHGHGVPGKLVHVHGRRTSEQMEAVTAVLKRILGDDVFVTVAPVWEIDPEA
jgi:phenylpyruvate tautomerase PptA (4-oxalocrotonate tautomerase family)